MDQLTICSIPEVVPASRKIDQVAALLSEVVSESFRLNRLGAQIEINQCASQFWFSVMTPVVSMPLPPLSSFIQRCGDDICSYRYFDQTLFAEFDDFESSIKKVEKWLSVLVVVERNLSAFQCRDPAPLEVMN